MLTLVAENDVSIRPIAPALDRNISFDPDDRFLTLVENVVPDMQAWLQSVRQSVPKLQDVRAILVSSDEELADILPEADAVITEGLTIDEAALSRAPRLRLVQKFGTNLINIDIEACRRSGVSVRTLRRVQNVAVAEHAFSLLMARAKRITYVNGLVTTRRLSDTGEAWNRIPGLVCLSGSVLGLIGFGEISREVAAMAKPFGMPILYTQRNRAAAAIEAQFGATYVSLPELLERSDFLSIHIPLNESTRYLLDAEVLKRAKRGLRLVNTARAAIIEPNALLDALHDGRIGSAALDVLYAEPARDDDPLLGLPNVILTPHLAGATRLNLLADVQGLALSLQEGLFPH